MSTPTCIAVVTSRTKQHVEASFSAVKCRGLTNNTRRKFPQGSYFGPFTLILLSGVLLQRPVMVAKISQDREQYKNGQKLPRFVHQADPSGVVVRPTGKKAQKIVITCAGQGACCEKLRSCHRSKYPPVAFCRSLVCCTPPLTHKK